MPSYGVRTDSSWSAAMPREPNPFWLDAELIAGVNIATDFICRVFGLLPPYRPRTFEKVLDRIFKRTYTEEERQRASKLIEDQSPELAAQAREAARHIFTESNLPGPWDKLVKKLAPSALPSDFKKLLHDRIDSELNSRPDA